MENKKGMTSLMLVAFVFIVVGLIILLGIGLYGLKEVNNSFLNVDLVLNGQNFTEIYVNGTGEAITTLIDTADNAGLLLILGMVVVMSIVGFIFKRDNKLWMVLDILIIIVAFTAGVYPIQTFDTFVTSTSANITAVYSDDLPNTFRLVSNLQILVPVIGVIIMFVTYGLTRKKEDRVGSDLGF